jgi:hypothetical protein
MWQTDLPSRHRVRHTAIHSVIVKTYDKFWSWVPKGARHKDGSTDRPSVVKWLGLWNVLIGTSEPVTYRKLAGRERQEGDTLKFLREISGSYSGDYDFQSLAHNCLLSSFLIQWSACWALPTRSCGLKRLRLLYPVSWPAFFRFPLS